MQDVNKLNSVAHEYLVAISVCVSLSHSILRSEEHRPVAARGEPSDLITAEQYFFLVA